MNLLSQIHFWSLREDLLIKHNDFGTTKYFTKKEAKDDLLYRSKSLHFQQRGTTWYLTNKRPYKLKDKLRELEDNLFRDKIICCSWEDCELHLLLSNGLLIDIIVNSCTNDIVNISLNRSLITKIGTESICAASISGKQIACICTDGRAVCLGGTWKDGWVIMECYGKKKIALRDRLLCIWGYTNVEHPQPWSPSMKDHHRANLLLYSIGLGGPELIACKKTEADPVEVIISRLHAKRLIVIEQKVSSRGAVSVEVSTLEASSGALKRLSLTSVPLQTQISCCTLNDCERQLLLGCIDGSIAILDRHSGLTRIIKTSVIPTFAVWHHASAIVALTNDKGQLQYFDVGLNRIDTQLCGEECTPVGLLDLSAYFSFQPNVSYIYWGVEHLLVVFERGPLTVITHSEGSLSFTPLIRQYLKTGKMEKCIRLLLNWEWNERCFGALQQIVAYLLKLPLTEENAKFLQNALSSFHNPSVPLSASVLHKYGSQVRALTRRFFHQLVRYKMFETAFLLAVDIRHHDLFMDLHYCATKIGEKEMAAAARAQASALLSRSSSEASCCSRSSCSQCFDSSSDNTTSSSSEEEDKEQGSHFSLSEYLPAFSDNCLTTNFNNIHPKTYNSDNNSSNYQPILPNVDLPKVSILPKPLFNNKPLNLSQDLPAVPYVPPLPVPLPFPHSSPFNARNSFPSESVPAFNPNPDRTQFKVDGTYPMPIHFCPPPSTSRFSRNSFSEINDLAATVTAPPLSQNVQTFSAATASSPLPLSQILNQSACNINVGKKPQAKVKFSDTVTAFIVPEIKRPVRPPLPPHIMDPQKELADSLPLCHPNEDYLKDFTPVRKNESEDAPPSQGKIKVVHFGVV